MSENFEDRFEQRLEATQADIKVLLAWALAQLAKAPACWRCGVLLPEEGVPRPEDRCAACGADLVPF